MSGGGGQPMAATPRTITTNGGGGNPLKNMNDINMQINLVATIELNEVQTTASLMKIKPPDEVHKRIITKKGPACIRQQSMSLFSNQNSPSCRKQSPMMASPALPPTMLNQDLPPMTSETKSPSTKCLQYEYKTNLIQEVVELMS